MLTSYWKSTIHNPTLDHFLGMTWTWCLSSLTQQYLSRLMYLGLWFSQQYTPYHQYTIELQWSWTIHQVQEKSNLFWIKLSKYHINTYFFLGSDSSFFAPRFWNVVSLTYIMQPQTQRLFGFLWYWFKLIIDKFLIDYIPYCISGIWLYIHTTYFIYIG